MEKWTSSLEEQTEIDASKAIPGPLTGDIEINHVSFRYNPNSPVVLNDVSLKVKPGEFVALVGHSGSGKSTLMRLLLGFETSEKGAIYYDGKDLATLELRHLRKQIGTVLQDEIIIGDSIRNYIVSEGFYNEEEVLSAIKMAGFEEDLKNFPMGLETLIINEGATLSGGQKQRLHIAKALVAKPKILLFDEATSSLDNKTQDIVSTNIAKLNVTRIVLAHRFSTIKSADRIYVFDKGQIKESGTFEDLYKNKGSFYSYLKQQKLD